MLAVLDPRSGCGTVLYSDRHTGQGRDSAPPAHQPSRLTQLRLRAKRELIRRL